MKKLILILSICGLSSCKICEDCTTVTTSNSPGFPPTTTTFEVCGRKDIDATEGTVTSTSGNVTVTSKTTCRR